MKGFFITFSLLYLIVCSSIGQHFELSSDFPNHQYSFGRDTVFFAGGVSFVDFNQDGWDDLTFGTTDGDSILFFMNNNGVFEKIPALVDHDGDSRQVLWVDYDNDGDLDLFVATFLGGNKLYQNDGNLNLTDISFSVGLGVTQDLSVGASFGDIDKDGDLDLYVSNHAYPPFANNITPNVLYLNDNGLFLNISSISNTEDSLRLSFCNTFGDYNNDGFPDLYIANDRYFNRNTMLRNLGDNTFDDISDNTQTGVFIDAMNVGVADFDYDRDLDIYVTNTQGNILFVNGEMGNFFSDKASDYQLTNDRISWGGSFMDIDNDGSQDLFVSSGNNGILAVPGDTSFYFLQDDIENNGPFTKMMVPGTNNDINLYANTHGDYNNDGQLDVAANSKYPNDILVWKNISSPQNWLKVKLEGTSSNRMGIGTWIEIYTNGEYMNRYTFCGEAFQAQPSDKIHFGLGNHAMIDSIQVTWPSGILDTYYDINTNQVLSFTENETNTPSSNQNIEPLSTFNISPNPSKQLNLNISRKGNASLIYTIYTVNGEKVLSGIIPSGTAENFNVPNSHLLADGIYLIQLNLEDGSSLTRKWLSF